MRTLTQELFEEVYKMFDASFPSEIKLSKEELKTNVFSGAFKMYILTLETEVIGCFVYKPFQSFVFIEYLFIKQSYQNKRYGSFFLAECIRLLSDTYSTLFLDCQEHLIPYYQKRGFTYEHISKKTPKGVELHLMRYGNPIEFVKQWIDI